MEDKLIMRVGYTYVPIQEFKDLYSYEEGMENGTLFKELHIPLSEYQKGVFQ